MYGMGVKSIASTLNCSIEEATTIKNDFFSEFPKVHDWIENTQNLAHKNGYVEDVWGRRRRLPDILLDKYVITCPDVYKFNPIIGSSGLYAQNFNKKEQEYSDRLKKARYKKDVDIIKSEINKNGFSVIDNTGFIARSERQCVNACIQGAAATMSKRAMVNVFNNIELKKLGFRLLIAVHDELIGECPIENVERCKELLSECMVNAAKPEVIVPFKCDATDFPSWYYDVYSSEVKKEYQKLCESNSSDIALNLLASNHVESTLNMITNIINN